MFVMPGKHSALITLNHASHSHNEIKTLCFFIYCVLPKECRIDGVIKKGGLDCPLLYQIHGVLVFFCFLYSHPFEMYPCRIYFWTWCIFFSVGFKVKCSQIIESHSSLCLLQVGQWTQAHTQEDLLLRPPSPHYTLKIVLCLW